MPPLSSAKGVGQSALFGACVAPPLIRSKRLIIKSRLTELGRDLTEAVGCAFDVDGLRRSTPKSGDAATCAAG